MPKVKFTTTAVMSIAILVAPSLAVAQKRKAARAPQAPAAARPSQATGNRPSWLPKPIDRKLAAEIYDGCGFDADAASHWTYILDTMNAYEEATRDAPYYTVFANQFLGIAKLSYANRSEANGWAGDFVRLSFLVAAKDLNENADMWNNRLIVANPLEEGDVVTYCLAATGALKKQPNLTNMGDLVALAAAMETERNVCLPILLGNRHYRRHLRPAFECYIKPLLRDAVVNSPPGKKYSTLVAAMLNLRNEHTKFIRNAVKPAFDANPVVGPVQKFGAKLLVSSDVDELRETVVEETLKELAGNNLLTGEDVTKILRTHDRCHCVY